jgi:hypothetical protein
MALYRKLLSNPEYTFKPEWLEEAVELWLCHNMGIFLRTNPSACKEVANSDEISGYATQVANTAPISDEYEDVIKKVMNELYDKYTSGHDRYGLYSITPLVNFFKRLAKAERADLIAEVPRAILLTDEYIQDYIPEMDSKAALKIIDKVDWSNAEWDDKNMLTLVQRLSPDDLKDLVSSKSRNARRFMSKVRRIPKIMAVIRRKLSDAPVCK